MDLWVGDVGGGVMIMCFCIVTMEKNKEKTWRSAKHTKAKARIVFYIQRNVSHQQIIPPKKYNDD